MSREIEYISENKSFTRKIVVSAKCDLCENELPIVNHEPVSIKTITGHQDWGRDSRESVEENEFCSLSCAISHITEFCSDNKSDTAYFHIVGDGAPSLELLKSDNIDYKGKYNTLLDKIKSAIE